MKGGRTTPRLTERGRMVRAIIIATIVVGSFWFGASTANSCWYGPCGPNDPVPTPSGPVLGPAWSTTCPDPQGCNLDGGTP